MKIKVIQGLVMQDPKCKCFLAKLRIDWDTGDFSELLNPKHFKTEEEVNAVLDQAREEIKAGKLDLAGIVKSQLSVPQGVTVH